MGLNRLANIVVKAVFEIAGFQRLFWKAARYRAKLDAAELRPYGNLVHIAFEFGKRRVGGPKEKG
jgi:hypothetical protein